MTAYEEDLQYGVDWDGTGVDEWVFRDEGTARMKMDEAKDEFPHARLLVRNVEITYGDWRPS
jgi:hypothetical protein